jgi:hypothetical protein
LNLIRLQKISGLTIIKILTILISLLALSCDNVGSFSKEGGDESAGKSVSFSGIESFDITSTGKILLNWTPPNTVDSTALEYEIFMDVRTDDVDVITANSLAVESLSLNSILRTFSLAEEAKGTLWELEGAMQPANNVAPLAQITSARFYQIEEQIFPDRTYIFQVRVKDISGQQDTNARTLVYRTKSAEELAGDYTGCTSTSSSSTTSITVNFAIPESASELMVLRNGEKIYSTQDQSATTYTDWGLKSGVDYEYRCQVVINGETLTGTSTNAAPQTADEAIGLPFDGCTSGQALTTSSIQIDYEFRNPADTMKVYRNGIEVYITHDTLSSSFIDTGLEEGVQYEYSCAALVEDKEVLGTNKLPLSTLTVNSPDFAGIQTASILNGTATVTWAPTSGVPVSYYNIWAILGTAPDYTLAPTKVIVAGNQSTTLTGFGDELDYNFAVRACNVSDQCVAASGDVDITTSSSDTGAPTTPGATAAVFANSKIEITAPWVHSNGAVAKRIVYRKIGGAATTNISDYTVAQQPIMATTVALGDVLTIPSNEIIEGNTYHFIVRDQDASGNTSTNIQTVSISINDLTPPPFLNGIDSLVTASNPNEETALVASWTAIKNESDPGAALTGAYQYEIRYIEGSGNSCAGAVYTTVLASTEGTVQTVTVSGLSGRTEYSVCVKALDSEGNYDTQTNNYESTYTLDVTPPGFDGIQTLTFDSGTQLFTASWNPSLDDDIDEYKIELWLNSTTPGAITTLRRSHASFSTGFTFDTDDFPYIENDEVYIIVNACDNGDTLPGSSENCSAIAYSTYKNLTVPDLTISTNFNGLSGIVSSAEGEITASWPTIGEDYAGFYLYLVDQNGTPGDDTDDILITPEVETCRCTDSDCATNPITSCTFENGDPNRLYSIHVRAFDAAGNITTYLDPQTDYMTETTMDSTAPNFNGTPSASLSGSDITISWSTATDNQYTGGGSVITYKVYRKADSDYSDTNDPANDGSLLGSNTTLSYVDSNPPDATTYYYVVCAEDGYSTPNVTCSPSKSYAVPDITVPTLTNLTSVIDPDNRNSITLTWDIDDGVGSADDDIIVSVYLQKSSSLSDLPTASGSYIQTDLSGDGVTTLEIVDAEFKYYNFLLVAKDEGLNVSADARISVLGGQGNIKTTNLLASYDSKFFATDTFPLLSSSWTDLTGNGNTATLTGGTSWNGTGTVASPYRLSLDGTSGTAVGFGTPLNGQSNMMMTTWIKPSSAETADSVILGNGGGAGTGILLKQFTTNHLMLNVGALTFVDYGAMVLADGAKGLWSLGETAGTTIVDSSVSANNGTLAGTNTLGEPGAINYSDTSIEFGSYAHHVQVNGTAASSYTDNFTFEAWVNRAGFQASRGILTTLHSIDLKGVALGTGLDGKVFFTIGTGGASTTIYADNALTTDEWHHVVAVRRSGTSYIYINGVEQADTATEAPVAVAAGELVIANLYQNSGAVVFGFGGKIDQVAIYDTALSAAQIQNHYAARYCVSKTTLVNDQWYQIGATWDGTDAKMYINGKEECSQNLSAMSSTGSTDMTIAATASDTNRWSGDVSEVQIYSSGSGADVYTNFTATANAHRETPLEGLVTDSLVYQLDPANSAGGLGAIPNGGAGCSSSVAVKDLSAIGNNGTLTGFSGTCSDGTKGWSGDGTAGNPHRIEFTGTNGEEIAVDETSLEFGAGDFSVESWFKGNDAGGFELASTYATGGARGWLLYQNHSSLSLTFWIDEAVCDATDGYSDDKWHHVVATRSGVNVTIYIDGQFNTTCSNFSGKSSDTDSTYGAIGARANYGVAAVEQSIGYTAVYSKALSGAEVEQNFNALADRFRAHPTTGIKENGLVFQLDPSNANSKLAGFTEDTACTDEVTLYDLSPSENNATFTGFGACGASSGWNGDGTVGDAHRLTFDDTDDQLVSASNIVADTITIEVWIKDTTAYSSIFTIGAHADFYLNYENGYIRWGHSNFVGTPSFTPTTWTHVVAIYDKNGASNADRARVYINGLDVSEYGSRTVPSVSFSGPFIIGEITGWNRWLSGSIGYLSVYDSVLSDAQIKQNCNALEYRFTAGDDICAN